MADADERLLVDAAQRDPSRFADLYERHFERVYAFVVSRVRDRDAAEDLTAETFHKALAGLAKYESRGAPFGAWLMRIAANAIVDRSRRDAREVVDSDHLPDPGVGPDVDRADEHARLFQLVDALPPDQQAVIVERFVDQRSIRETAQRLGKTEGAVTQLQFRAVETLRRLVRGPHRGTRGGVPVEGGDAWYSLPRIEDMLRDLPRREFRARLKRDLERMAASMTTTTERVAATRQTATPQLRVRNAPAAIDFYTNAFGARELMRFEAGGRIAHAELEIGNSMILLGEEAPEYGFPSPEALGGSPVGMRLYVDDADALVERAVRAGARLVMPVSDQFYGDRTGRVVDPFGYGWAISTRKEDMTVDEMHRRMAAMEAEQQATRTAQTFIPKGFRTVTPYVVVHDAPGLIAFTTRVFGAEEVHRAIGPGGGIHAEVRIDDSIMMIGGGEPPDRAWRGQQWTTAFHIYVRDTDAAFARAVAAGASVLHGPMDQEYGERSAGVKDAFGNTWYIATATGAQYIPEGLQTVNVYLHPLRAEPVLAFMTRAFGAVDVEKYASPDGVVHHAKAKIGDSVIEMGEAHGPYQPMPTRFYLYVPNVDATYHRALVAGATSVSEPADQPYGDRNAGVKDAFGNEWFIATQIRETP